MTTRKSNPPQKVATVPTEQLCRLFGLTAARVGQLAKDGIIYRVGRAEYDLWKSIKGYINFLQKSKVGGAQNIEKSGKDNDPQELEELVKQVKAAKTYNDARTLKVQIDALRAGYALEVEQNSYCALAEIEEAMTGIAAIVRSAIKRMEADLPPMLEGLPAEKIKQIISLEADKTIQMIYDEGAKIKKTNSLQVAAQESIG